MEVGQSFIIACGILTHNLLQLFANPTAVHDASTHWFSITFVLPFIGVCLALLVFNWYPSEIFIGDCFTYFAGMTFAVVGILGHFSKTLLLFFIPQVLNFLISLPQLIGIIPCPRHRLPKYNAKYDTLEAVPQHHNLINYTLRLTGPMHEQSLCLLLMAFQMVCCALALVLRHYAACWVYTCTV